MRYEPGNAFGVIASPSCNIAYDFSGNLAITGGVQDAGVWNLRQAQKVTTFVDKGAYNNYPFNELGEVTVVTRSPDKCTVAIGYSTGDIRVFNYLTNTHTATLRGHRSAVTSLAYDTTSGTSSSNIGLTLVSGGADTDIYVWDLVGMQAHARLRGHHDAVTGVLFLRRNVGSSSLLVVSSSKDAQLKVWDTETRYCIQTLLGHRSEIWSMCLLPYGSEGRSSIIITGTADDQLRGFRLKAAATAITTSSGATDIEHIVEALDDEETVLEPCGSVARASSTGNDRVTSLVASAGATLVAAQTSGRVVNFFRVRSHAQARVHRKRSLKKAKAREAKKGSDWDDAEKEHETILNGSDDDDVDGHDSDSDDDNELELQLPDILEMLTTLRCSAKLRGCAFHPIAARNGEPERFLVSLVSNCLETYKVPTNQGSQDELIPAKTMIMDMQGHRSDVRAVALSGDGTSVASCSTDGVKLWSLATNKCIRNCTPSSSGDVHGTCLAFAPGGRLLVLGTKDGTCDIIDTASGMCIQSIPHAHHVSTKENSDEDGDTKGIAAIWAVAMRPDGRGFCTGGADKFVKFWEFEGDDDAHDDHSKEKVYVSLEKQLKMESDVLCLCYNHQKSNDKLIVAIGLLDSTVKLFFEDSMKFFLSLYGHKLPVLAVDISNDGKILVSGSADKTIKIWGLDFGDCHRSLVGHTDSITSLRFQDNTHYFFSGSKDGSLKYWDADR